MKKKFVFAFLLGSCMTLNSFAQHANNSENEKSVNLDQVVVTGTGTHQRLKNTPAPVEVITGFDIKKTGITDFQQAMTILVPSLSFSGGGAMGTYLMMNGLSNKYVLILINGRKLSGDITNNIDLSRIDLNRVKRIEILDGAASSLYGSDAIAGVINIITDEPKNIIQASSNTKYEEYGMFTQSVNLDLSNSKFGSYTSFKHDQSSGWQQSKDSYEKAKDGTLTTIPTLSQSSNGFHSNIINQRFTYSPSDKLSFYADGGYYWKLTDRPGKQDDIDGGFTYDIHYESFKYGLGGRFKPNKKAIITLDLINDNYNQNYKYIRDDKDFKVGDYNKTKKQKFYNAELKSIFKFTENSTSVFGVDYRSESLDRPSANVDKSVYTTSIYGQHEIKLWNHFTGIAGLRYDYHETAKGRITPKIALMYSVNNFNFRGTYSAGYRAPGLDELYYYLWKSSMGSTITIGDENLKPEKSNYYSLNAEYSTSRFSFSITGYLNYVDDMISSKTTKFSDMPVDQAQAIKDKVQKDFNMTPQQVNKLANYKEYQNLQEGQVKGFNIRSSAYLGYGFRIDANYAYASAQGKDKDGEWGAIERSVRQTATIATNYLNEWGKYRLNVNLNTRLQSKRLHPNDTYGDAPGYGVWNIYSKHTFSHFKHFILEPGIGINNILDKVDSRPYGVNYGLLSPGRTVFVSLNLQFK